MLNIDKDWLFSSTREERRLHLKLNEDCLVRGGSSPNHKGVLAEYLNSTIPEGKTKGRILLCHACHNPKCSNPHHIYWGSDRDNMLDSQKSGTWKSPWQKTVEKHGLEKATNLQRIAHSKSAGGKGNKGKSKSVAHKKAISVSKNK